MAAIFSFFIDIWNMLYSIKPSYLSRKPTYNFIDVHGAWIMGNALTAACLLMIGTKLPFVDALFMGSGAATQSGLNTVDLNSLKTWQQAVLYAIPMWTNPIIINTFVALLRRIWFERRMKAVVASANSGRRTIGRTMSRSRVRDVADEERGLNGRRIIVMHGDTRPTTPTGVPSLNEVELAPVIKDEVKKSEEADLSSSSSSAQSGSAETTTSDPASEHGAPLRPQITFADQPKPIHPEHGKMGANLSSPGTPHHLLLRRSQSKDPDAVLRIPSPRDAEMGVTPRALGDADQMTRPVSRGASTYSRASAPENENSSEIPTMPRRGITIAEPSRPSTVDPAAASTGGENQSAKSPFLDFRMPKWTKRAPKEEDDANGAELHPIRSRISTIASFFKSTNDEAMPYLSWNPTIGRNSAFADLTEEQREELGGIEYRALKLLVKILVGYFLSFTLFGIVCLTPWIMQSQYYGTDVVNAAGLGRPWWAIYTSSSAFNDVGFTLTPDSMVSFGKAQWPLVAMSYLIIIGNTGFPIMLRVTIWFLSIVVPKDSSVWEELKFLLDHPRRCFTLLFPSKETWTLFWILCGLNGLDLLLYVVLDLNTTAVSQSPVNIRILNGWFQACSTRTAGFSVVDLSALHPSVQISYLIMMYISIFPIAISVRRTNVYEEKSLGVYHDPSEVEDERQPSYIGSHLRRQLSYDLWYIFLGYFIISIAEGSRLGDDTLPRFSMFALLFEIVSAYGTVGLSLGYPNKNQSFSVELKTISKLVIIAMEIRGRHRGLPYGLDRAIMLPSEKRQLEEQAEAAMRIQRRMSMNSNAPSTVGGPLQRIRTRSTERGRTGYSIIGSFLGPGPSMPIHRRTQKEDPLTPSGPTRRRHSVGTTGMRARRESLDMEPPRNQFFQSFFSGSTSGTAEARPSQKPEGRRHFFQEGVNPAPKPDSNALPPKLEGKQA